jgi:hypothetical protein
MAKCDPAPTCNHVKPNGQLCDSPSLKHDDYCYFHRSLRERTKRNLRDARQQKSLQIPPLEDIETIQIAIGDVVNALLADRIDAKKAGLALYGLQTAACHVEACSFEVSEYDERIETYTEHEQVSMEAEIAQEIEEEQQPQTAKRAKKNAVARLPKKKPASRVSKNDFWKTVGAMAKQNAVAVADELKQQILAEEENVQKRSKPA